MAIDHEKRLKVCAIYESHDWSPKEIKDNRFPNDVDIKVKTIESWVTKYKLKKNRFASEKEAIDTLIEYTLPLEEAKEIIKNKLNNDALVEVDIIDGDEKEKYAGIVGKELAFQVLNVHSLQAEIANNLNQARTLAGNSKALGAKSAYHSMLVSAYQLIHGKDINIIPKNPSQSLENQVEVSKQSDSELIELLKGEGVL